MKPLLIIPLLFLAPTFAHGEVKHSIYFVGYVRHLKPTPETHQGDMNFLGYSMELRKNEWQFEPGINTYIDSYGKRSYSVFTDISHEAYAYPYFRPLLGLSCMYKGTDYGSDKMAAQCFPLLKFRIGEETKLFANITPVPRIGDLTNGFFAVELGYKW